MGSRAETVLIQNPATGRSLTYGELLDALSADRVEHAPVCCPSDALATVRALVCALVLDQPLTLLDPLLTESERRNLGIDDRQLTKRRPIPGVPLEDSHALVARIKDARNFRLTLLTSGSTGLPKQVTHRLDSLARAVREGERQVGAVWALVYNPTHIAGVQVILQALFNRNTIIDCFQAPSHSLASMMSTRGVTHLSATPTFYRLLLPLESPQPGVRAVTLGGERADAALIERLREAFPEARIRNIYASTEAGTLLTAVGDVFEIPAGLADQIRIRDDQLDVHRSLLGEGPDVDPDDPWYASGDLVEVVSEKPLLFRFRHRDRDWINVGGEKVNPAEVEEAILTYPGVHDVRVFGRANSVLGSILCAEVRSASQADESALREYLSHRLHPARIPRMIRFVDTLPRGRTGKRSTGVPSHE